MSLLEVLRNPKAFFVWLKSEPVNTGMAWVILGAAMVLPNAVLMVANFMQPNLLLVSLVVAAIFLGALIGFVALSARGAQPARALEVVAYSLLPFTVATLVFGLLTVLGPLGIVVGQGLLFGATLMGWYRLYLGLEVMTGEQRPAVLGALLGPIGAVLFTFFVPGLLLRAFGL
jgi:hypothetical protein